ncbi:MAG TPA: integrin alpha [Myxococcota bacterium]|nr:integrin alpha [Myxococcota bacterium]
MTYQGTELPRLEVEPFSSCETDGCEHPGSLFGWTVHGGDDLTGDGVLDIAIGSPGFEFDTSTNDKGPGAVYIYSGGG